MVSDKKKEKPTLQNIATATGYSRNTVSLAMRDSPRLPEATKRLIQKTAEQLGYKPNLTARNLSTGKSGLIGVYASTLHDAVRTEIVNGLITELRSARYSPILALGHGHRGSWETSAWIENLEQLNVEAMVIVREFITRIPARMRETPKIILGCQPHEPLECDYIALDRYEAAEIGIDYLTDRGHHNILVCANKDSHFALGCEEEIQRKGAVCHSTDTLQLSDSAYLHKLLSYVTDNGKNFSALIFGDSPTAVEFITLLTEQGTRVPDDLAVISYDYFPYSRHLRIPLTTIVQPIESLVTEAVSLVQNRLENPGSRYIHKTLKHRILPGESA